MAEKVLRGDLDDKSRDMQVRILEKDRKSIEKLKNFAIEIIKKKEKKIVNIMSSIMQKTA